ncbi:DUF3352 domain-containing protein [Candidatus Peregrinibacteria bacterium]|nr:DUF3352 domain-containing protein [Candidatus Peregrinibacteria bacterium]
MGRKSNTKKIVRQLIKEKGKKQSFFDKFFGEKNKKDIKKEVLKSKNEESLNRAHGASAQRGEQSGSASCETKRAYNKEKKKTVKKSNKKFAFIKARKHKIFGGMLALIMLLILGYVGFLIFQRAFRPEPIAKFLPQDKVMAFIEINSNFDHQQVKKTFDLLSKYPELSKEKLIEKAEGKFLFSYERELKPWLGRNIGMAFFSDNSMVYFGEVFSGKNAKKFLASKNSYLKTNYKDRDFYMSPTGGNFVFIGDYLFFSEKKSTLEYLVDFNNDRKNSIYSSREYGKMASNLPLNKAGFLYLNFNELRKSNLIQNEFLKTFMKLLSRFNGVHI